MQLRLDLLELLLQAADLLAQVPALRDQLLLAGGVLLPARLPLHLNSGF